MFVRKRTFHISDHAVDCFSVMKQLQRSRDLCDVTLLVDGKEFHAHRVILAGVSPYLRAMFTNGMLESAQRKIELQGIDASTMESLVEFAYTGSVEVNVENVQCLLAGATMLGIMPLKSACSNFLKNQLDSGNCIGIRQFADHYSCEELELAAREFINQNFMEIMKNEEFLQLTFRNLIELLKSDKLQVRSEEDVYIAFETWLFKDYEGRKDFIPDILQYIRFPQLSLEFLQSKVYSSHYIKSNAQCHSILAEVMNESSDNLPKHLTRRRALPRSIFAIGGRNSVECQLSTLERYDMYENEWYIEPSMNLARTAVGAASFNGLLYTIGKMKIQTFLK